MLFSVLREPVLSLPAATRSGFFFVFFFNCRAAGCVAAGCWPSGCAPAVCVSDIAYIWRIKKYSIGISQQSQTNYSAVPEDLPTSQHKAAHQGRQLFGDDVILFELILHSVSVFNPHKRLPKSRSFCAYFSTFLSLNRNLVIWGYAVFVS